jgi:hypothetical protein
MFCNTNHDVHDHMFAHSFYEGPTGSGQGYSLPHSQGVFVDTKYEGGVVHLVRGSMILWGGGVCEDTRRRKIHPRLIPKWHQIGTRLATHWYQTGIRLGPDWYQIGTRLVPDRLVPDWHGARSAPDWYQIGTRLVPDWYQSHNSTVCV